MDTTQLSAALTDLALDLRWAWNHAADDLWRRLDPDLWESTGNAWFVLQTVSKQKLQTALSDPEFQRILAEIIEKKRQRDEAPHWFQQTQPNSPSPPSLTSASSSC
jgi:starch phosphorylase